MADQELKPAEGDISHVCRNCGKEFKTVAALSTHANAFCTVMPTISSNRLREGRDQIKLKPILKKTEGFRNLAQQQAQSVNPLALPRKSVVQLSDDISGWPVTQNDRLGSKSPFLVPVTSVTPSGHRAYDSENPSLQPRLASAQAQELLRIDLDTDSAQTAFQQDNQRFKEVALSNMRARERSMFQELSSLTQKKDKIKFLRQQQVSLAERIRLEIKQHSWKEDQANAEQRQINMALQEIEKSKQAALEQYKNEELKRLFKERQQQKEEREAILNRRQLNQLKAKEGVTQNEPEDGMMAMHAQNFADRRLSSNRSSILPPVQNGNMSPQQAYTNAMPDKTSFGQAQMSSNPAMQSGRSFSSPHDQQAYNGQKAYYYSLILKKAQQLRSISQSSVGNDPQFNYKLNQFEDIVRDRHHMFMNASVSMRQPQSRDRFRSNPSTGEQGAR